MPIANASEGTDLRVQVYNTIGIVDNVDDFDRISSTDDVINVDDKSMFSSIALQAQLYAIH